MEFLYSDTGHLSMRNKTHSLGKMLATQDVSIPPGSKKSAQPLDGKLTQHHVEARSANLDTLSVLSGKIVTSP